MAAKRLFLFLTLFILGVSPAAVAATLEGIDRLHDAAVTTRDFEKVVSLIKEGNRPPLSRDEWAWRLARAYFRLGKLSGEAEARAFYNHCLESAKQAIAHNGRSAPGYLRGVLPSPNSACALATTVRTSPMRRVRPLASKNSRISMARLRPMLARSR